MNIQLAVTKARKGFTMIELMVVITIMVIILSMTVYGVNYLSDADRVSGAASQVQSYLSGARDRAIHAQDLRGVRLFVDPANTRAVTGLAYVEPGARWTVGTVDLLRLDEDGPPPDGVADGPNIVRVSGLNLGWWQLKRRGLIVDGALIELPRGSNSFYEIDTSLIDITTPPNYTMTPPQPETLLLRIPYSEPGGGSLTAVRAHSAVPYLIQLPSQLMPLQPSLLPEDVIIDLDASQIPVAWRPNLADDQGQFSPYMDIFFSPRGGIVGTSASAGLLHLCVCDGEDSLHLKELYVSNLAADDPTWPNPPEPNTGSALDTFEAQVRGIRSTPFVRFNPGNEAFGTWTDPDGSGPEVPLYTVADPYVLKERRIITLYTQTGAVTSNEVDGLDADGNGFADNPFAFAESGIGAK